MTPPYLRAGRKALNTLYEGSVDDPDGTLIGVVNTPDLADEICAAVNMQRALHAAGIAIAPNGSVDPDRHIDPDGVHRALRAAGLRVVAISIEN